MKRLIAMSVMAVALCACSTAKKVSAGYENVIPLPQEITVVHEPPFIIKKNTRILYPEGGALLKKNAEFLAGCGRGHFGISFDLVPVAGDDEAAVGD